MVLIIRLNKLSRRVREGVDRAWSPLTEGNVDYLPDVGRLPPPSGAQQSPRASTVHGKAARPIATTMHRPAPPSSKDSCFEHISELSNLCPSMYSDAAQQQQHAHDAAAPHQASLCQALSHQAECLQATSHHTNSYPASLHQVSPYQASLSQANPYQQIPLHSAAADCYPAKHDSFRMISSAVPSGSADRLRSLSGSQHQQRCSSQRRKHPSIQREPAPKKPRAVNIAELASPQADCQGQQAEVAEAMERRRLQTLKHRVEPPGLAGHWLDAPVTPHSLPFQTSAQSTACTAGTAGSAGAACPAALRCTSSSLPASMQQLRDPRLKAEAEAQQGAPACFPRGSDPPRQDTHHTPPQTVPQHRQVWPEGPSGRGPPAALAGLRTVPLATAPSGASSYRAESRLDDSVHITPDHRQTWDWSHGPLDGFRALCQARMLQRQQQLLSAARRCSMPRTASPHPGNRAGVFDPQRNRQNYPTHLPLPERSSTRQLSSQRQLSLPHHPAGRIALHHSPSSASRLNPSASRFSSPPPAYPSELWHELLPPSSSSSSSSSAQQPYPLQRPSFPASPVLLPSSLPHPGLRAQGYHTSSWLSPARQPPPGSAAPSAPPSALLSGPPACQDVSLPSSSAFQQGVQSASALLHCQIPQNTPSVSRAPNTPPPWQSNTSFDFPVVHGLPKLGASVWRPDAVVPDNTCIWRPDPRLAVGDPQLMVGDYGQAGQKGHVGPQTDADLALQELQDSTLEFTLEWMASELVQAGSSDARFCF